MGGRPANAVDSRFILVILRAEPDPLPCHRYMFDPEATRRSFDEDGFYLTGDIAQQKGGLYYIEGRASIDSQLPLPPFPRFFLSTRSWPSESIEI